MKPAATLSAADQEDGQAMAQLAAGQGAALNRLMERHAEKLFHFLVRALQNGEDAADLAQETFCRVYHNRAKFDPGQKFSTWLYAIAANLVKDRYRYRARHPHVSLDSENPETEAPLQERLVDPQASPSERLQSAERVAAVRQAVAALPEELRLPLILAEYENHSQAEIAATLGCSIKAVETRIYRARQRLRETLAPVLRG
jgi:RNA polymerase sigma-70 factor (ECF subfamily)